jgi:RNA polymerase sigma-70 factor (ECF subfamily)
MTNERSNEAWLADLQAEGPRREAAVQDLLTWLKRRLFFYLRERSDLRDLSEDELAQMAADFAQESVLIILEKLDQFKGHSKFTTWAAKIAVHQALGELRRARWRDVSLEALTAEGQLDPTFLLSDPLTPEETSLRRAVVQLVAEVMNTELSERQRLALIARLVQGVPIEVLAAQMNTNPNALYKLLHDARKRLKARLLERGISPEEVLATFG